MVLASTSALRRPHSRRRLSLLGSFLLGSAFLLSGNLGSAGAAPAVGKMLEYRPRHEVAVSTPTATEVPNCKVELVKSKTGGSGWLLRDAQGRIIRKFFSSDGRNVDSYSYYKDGAEVYREIVTPNARTPDHFRWLNTGGSKYGIDEDRNGSIDSWKVISPEEVSQEALRALATRDLHRLEALLISDEDIRALGLPADMATSLQNRRKGLKDKFETTISKLTKLSVKAQWLHLETGAPQCLPAEEIGTRNDLIRYSRATVLYETGSGNEWFQLGQLIQVGAAWKLIDAPTAGAVVEEPTPGGPRTVDIGQDPKLQKAIEELTTHDKKTLPTTPAEAVRHHLNRADILEKIVAMVKPAERDPWIRQVADSLASAYQVQGVKDTTAADRLTSLEQQLVKHMAGSNLAAYVSFRRLQADYGNKLSGAKVDFNAVQKDWLEKLTAYVKDYPRCDDTADAMLQLGMVCEFLGKEVEAKNWYTTLTKTFPDKPQTAKALGATRRLSLEGQVMRVVGPQLSEPNTTFDINTLAGKVVIIYYWASWNGQAASDFNRLKKIVDDSNKQVELVGVNLDTTTEEARAFLAKNPAPGVHLHQPGGLESKLASAYGIMVLPNIFVVGKDGKCVSKNAQINALEEEVKKILKK